jgi:MinD-like ATPase involved in chromosome partitioning or flagellar assembly
MRVALAVPIDDERRLSASAEHFGHVVTAVCSGGDELALRLAQQPVDVAIVAATPAHLTAALVESADLRGVRMVVVADDPEARRHAKRRGIVDVATGPAGWGLLDGDAAPTLPAEHPSPGPEASAPAQPATVVAVWGPHGAPGRTSIAIALAAELASAGLRVVLADADTHAAAVAPSLGLLDEAPGFAAACRLAGLGGLDESQFERIAHLHNASGTPFRVLTGIGRPERWPELGEDRIEGVLTAVRQYCVVVVVDLAASLERDEHLASDVAVPRRNAAALAVLRSADRVLAVAAADPVGIARFLRARTELVELVGADRTVVVVNKVRSSVIGLDPGGQVRQTLARFGGVEDAALIPWDHAAFDAALLGGRPLGSAAPRSAARQAVRELAERLVPASAGAGARRRRGRRLA